MGLQAKKIQSKLEKKERQEKEKERERSYIFFQKESFSRPPLLFFSFEVQCFKETKITRFFWAVNVQLAKMFVLAMVRMMTRLFLLDLILYIISVLAVSSIANIVKSSLGPVGLDKMLVDEIGVSVVESFKEH